MSIFSNKKETFQRDNFDVYDSVFIIAIVSREGSREIERNAKRERLFRLGGENCTRARNGRWCPSIDDEICNSEQGRKFFDLSKKGGGGARVETLR